MTTSDIVARTADHVKTLLSGEGSGHDWWHVYRVWQNALHIGMIESVDLFTVELAALLHDIADWKFHGGDEFAGSRAARAWLTGLQVEPSVIDHVCRIIDDLSFKGAGVTIPMKSREGMVVQDADRLDALGAIGIARAFAYGGSRGREMHNPAIPPQFHSTFEEYKNSTGTTLNHFHEKLLLLKDRMNTPTGKQMALNRHAYMQAFVDRFLGEWRGDT
jgi:uncharacterized protein